MGTVTLLGLYLVCLDLFHGTMAAKFDGFYLSCFFLFERIHLFCVRVVASSCQRDPVSIFSHSAICLHSFHFVVVVVFFRFFFLSISPYQSSYSFFVVVDCFGFT